MSFWFWMQDVIFRLTKVTGHRLKDFSLAFEDNVSVINTNFSILVARLSEM